MNRPPATRSTRPPISSSESFASSLAALLGAEIPGRHDQLRFQPNTHPSHNDCYAPLATAINSIGLHARWRCRPAFV